MENRKEEKVTLLPRRLFLRLAALALAAVLALTTVGIATMWWAVFADVGVMVLAVLNATRMLRD